MQKNTKVAGKGQRRACREKLLLGTLSLVTALTVTSLCIETHLLFLLKFLSLIILGKVFTSVAYLMRNALGVSALSFDFSCTVSQFIKVDSTVVLDIVLFYRIKMVHKKSPLNCLTQSKNVQRGSSRLYYLTSVLINYLIMFSKTLCFQPLITHQQR